MAKATITQAEKKFLKELGAKLRAIRHEHGWTLEQAEERGWKTWQHLVAIENGKKNVTAVTLRRLASLYKISLPELFADL